MIQYSTNKKINDNIINLKHNSNFRIIRRFIKMLNKFDYECFINKKSNHGTLYLGFNKIRSNKIDFVFRFSDHLLNKGNYIPAGVINEYATLKGCMRDFQFYLKKFNKMSKEELEVLGENRLIF